MVPRELEEVVESVLLESLCQFFEKYWERKSSKVLDWGPRLIRKHGESEVVGFCSTGEERGSLRSRTSPFAVNNRSKTRYSYRFDRCCWQVKSNHSVAN